MSEPIQAYPLQWPPGWPRKQPHQRTEAKFRKGTGGWVGAEGAQRYQAAERVSLSEGISRVRRELRAFGVPEHNIVISSDLRLRIDGQPYSAQATSKLDPGIAVYWQEGKRRRCIAIDRYDRLADNLAAIAATLEAMRAIERHGGAEILDRAFTGFVALPASEQWFTILGVSAHATREQIEEAYRRLAMKHHPDRPGGDAGEMLRVNAARTEGLEQALA
ncbi:MAG TPA: J domain-containing protein [Steroidobacteraceae bacterium]|nr:J domain-containing protein [Steroidobacteraceae bacterium]